MRRSSIVGAVAGAAAGAGGVAVAATLLVSSTSLSSFSATGIAVPTPTPTAEVPRVVGITMTDGDGRIETADTLTVAFSTAIRPSTVCSSFSDTATTAQTAGGNENNGIVVTLQDHAATGRTADQLEISSITSVCSGTIAFGILDLGSPNWTAQTVTYKGPNADRTTLTLSADRTSLALKLGSGAATPATAQPATAVSFAPSSVLKDNSGSSFAAGSAADRRF